MAEVARLEIVMDDAGRVSVSGCIDNKLISYGLLSIAKDVVLERAKSMEQKVQPASVVDMHLVNGNKRGS